MLDFLDNLIKKVNFVALKLAMLCMIGMLVIVCLNVVLRYFFAYSITWTEEAARFMMVWTTFLLFPYAQQRGELVALDFVTVKWRHTFPGVVLALILEGLALMVLGFCVYHSYGYIMRSFSSVSFALQLPMWMVVSVLPFSFIMTMLASFVWFCRLAGCLANPAKLKDLDARRATL